MDAFLQNTPLEPEHLKAIEALAEELGWPVAEVNNAYVSALENYRSNARIQHYLAVLTSKKVRGMLRRKVMSHSFPAATGSRRPQTGR